MGANSAKEADANEAGEVALVREPEDIFKSLFRAMAGSVSGSTKVTVESFIAAIKNNPPALKLMAALGDGGSNIKHKALLKGDAEALAAVFKAMDTNSDGELTWGEWCKYVGARRNVLTGKLFKSLDSEGVGSVANEKFAAAIKAEPIMLDLYNLNGCSAEGLVAKMDANGDGKISHEELQTIIKDVATSTPRKKPSKASLVPPKA